MDTDKKDAPVPKARWRRETLIPTVAVAVVAVTAVVTAVMTPRADTAATAVQGDAASLSTQGVVQAPPLNPTGTTPALAGGQAAESRSSSALGAAAACRTCGVVETVVAVHGYGQPKARGYQMHIRMDDGSTRTVEQRGALAAGSRVVVEGGSVRPMRPPPAGQG